MDAPSIVQRLQQIVDSEGREAEPEALQILARRADGSMRDSQSLLEQLLAYCSGTVRVEDVHRMLGTAASGRLVALTNCLLGRDAAGALAGIDEGVTQGVDCGQLAEQLLGYFRDIMAVVVGGSAGSTASRQRGGLPGAPGSRRAARACRRRWRRSRFSIRRSCGCVRARSRARCWRSPSSASATWRISISWRA